MQPVRVGLTSEEAAERRAADGPNVVAAIPPRRLLGRIGRQLADPLVALLLAAAVITTLLRDLPDTAVIVLVIAVNTAIGVTQEVRADAAIAALDRLAAPQARVVRDGDDLIIPAADVVRGDLVRLEAGDIVPADLVLAEAERATFDESSLTGESVPVARQATEPASAGTVLVTGRAAGLVERVGPNSSLGRIAALVASARPGLTPLQRRLAGLGRILGVTALAVSAIVFGLGVLAGQPIVRMAITAVSLVVAAVPESLPAVVTLALALGARRMAHANAIPRRLHAVETLGSVTVIAADKTGTLTENRMAVQQAVSADGRHYRVTGHGYEPVGSIHPAPDPGGALQSLARAGLLCNDADLIAPVPGHPDWAAAGDPMEAALVAFAARCGLDPHTERAKAPRVAELPFDQSSRHMTTVHRLDSGEHLTVRKGAPERLVEGDLLTAAEELAAAGLRVLAIATATTPGSVDPVAPPPLRVCGLVGIGDPVRAGAPATTEAFEQAGVHLLLITGDHPATAAAIGAQLGIDDSRIHARTRPEGKLDIIAGLQKRGEVVAMTGDGVNDAPALRRADIGVAMGGGTEVARQAAELVLVDDNLATVATAIGEGRRIYDNIRRFLRYALTGGLAELLVMLAGPLLGMPLALLPGQLLWINLLTHGIPGVALGAEPAEAGVLRRPPRPPQESVLGAGLLRGVLLGGAGVTAVTLAAGVAAQLAGRPWQSAMFVVLGLAQLGVALAVRARPVAGTRPNRWLPAAVALSAALQLAGVLTGPLRTLLTTEPLTAVELVACAAVAALPGLMTRAFRGSAG
ncbi:Ca2+-transporting ATPase [Actinoplanes octamycinicus]|uniref:Ca2+-transporting ATPase n=1 Tax=Actinoplanes octamycinicus TaxID=135948 RepID=A0A7W7H2P9_9ACTN|nr:cation-transporting P-type ATPase [Actinoplanes octamycinicus]MBB4742855.1 Ca2+-transporting ATPase [Actinoplanes octamycinicus]GIE58292.1 cation-transporting P-type ATPase [Actinoplanes octamycinicus]